MRIARLLLVPLLLFAGCGDPPDFTPGAKPGTAAGTVPAFADLAHGGRLVVVQDLAAERVEGVIRFRAGSIHDPAGQVGLTEVLADALGFGGPMQYSGVQLHDTLREQDAWLQVSSGTEFLSFDFACPPGSLDSTLGAIADLVRFPHYPPEFVDRARERLLERLAAEAVDPAAIADQVLLDVAYGPQAPYTRAPTFESVEAVEREDLLAFHRANLGADRLQVGIAGPLDAAAVRSALATALGELEPVGPAPVIEQPPFARFERVHLVFVDLPGAERTEIRVGLAGVSIHDPDYAALRLWSDAHGSAESSGLELADDSLERGLVTRMGAFFRPRWTDPGEFLAYATTTHADPHRALGRLTMWIHDATLEGDVGVPLPDEVVAAARERVTAADTRMERGRELVGRLLDLEAHDLDATFWRQHALQVRETGAERMRVAAEQHAGGSSWLIVTVGPPEIETVYPIEGTAETRSAAFAPRGTPEGLAALARVLDPVAGLGARAAWANLARLDQHGEVRTRGALEPVGVRLWRDFEGDRLRLEQLAGEVESLRVVTPEQAWSVSGERSSEISREVLASVRFREARQLPRVLRDLATRRSMSVRLAGERLEVLHWGRLRCWMELGADGRPTMLGYPGTETERQGESEFKVWTERIEGIVLPSVIAEPTLGRSYLWTSARVNEPFAEELFERP